MPECTAESTVTQSGPPHFSMAGLALLLTSDIRTIRTVWTIHVGYLPSLPVISLLALLAAVQGEQVMVQDYVHSTV